MDLERDALDACRKPKALAMGSRGASRSVRHTACSANAASEPEEGCAEEGGRTSAGHPGAAMQRWVTRRSGALRGTGA
jgi:hypothetical protein